MLLLPDIERTFSYDDPFRLPMNRGSATSTSNAGMSTSEDSILTASFDRAIRSTSKVLIMADCWVTQGGTVDKEVTLRIRRGNTNDETLVQELVTRLVPDDASNSEHHVVTFAVADSPASTAAMTYSLRGLYSGTGAAPTIRNRSLVLMELPPVTKIA